MVPIARRLSPASHDATERRDLAAAVVLDCLSPATALAEWPTPRAAHWIVWGVAAFLASCIGLTEAIEIDRVITGTGRVVSKVPTILVQPLDMAVVRSILVHEGDKVGPQDVLARLDPTFAGADLETLRAQVGSLDAEVSRLTAEVTMRDYRAERSDASSQLQAAIFAGRQAEYRAKTESYDEKIAGLTAQASHSAIDAGTMRERLAIAQDVEAMRKSLAEKEVGSRLNWLIARDSRLEIGRDLASSEATGASARANLASEIAERDAYRENWISQARQSLSEQSTKLSDAREQLRKAQLRRAMVDLRADRDATVLTIAKVSEGSVLQPGEPFITLVPANAPLEVEAEVPGRDSGLIRVGDPVQIKFDAFPFARHGVGEGRVSVVSADSFGAGGADARDARNAAAPQTSMPYYRVRIAIDRAALQGVPAGFRPTAGMPVTADITVGKHTLGAYFMERIMTVAHEAMHEP